MEGNLPGPGAAHPDREGGREAGAARRHVQPGGALPLVLERRHARAMLALRTAGKRDSWAKRRRPMRRDFELPDKGYAPGRSDRLVGGDGSRSVPRRAVRGRRMARTATAAVARPPITMAPESRTHSLHKSSPAQAIANPRAAANASPASMASTIFPGGSCRARFSAIPTDAAPSRRRKIRSPETSPTLSPSRSDLARVSRRPHDRSCGARRGTRRRPTRSRSWWWDRSTTRRSTSTGSWFCAEVELAGAWGQLCLLRGHFVTPALPRADGTLGAPHTGLRVLVSPTLQSLAPAMTFSEGRGSTHRQG